MDTPNNTGMEYGKEDVTEPLFHDKENSLSLAMAKPSKLIITDTFKAVAPIAPSPIHLRTAKHLPKMPDTELKSDTTKVATNRGRKRTKLNAEAELARPNVKRRKTGNEIRKPPACKLCYHKHIGCERATEDEPCVACIKRHKPCERNDVKVVKGVKKSIPVADDDTKMFFEGDIETDGFKEEKQSDTSTQHKVSIDVVSEPQTEYTSPFERLSSNDLETNKEEFLAETQITMEEYTAATILLSMRDAETNTLNSCSISDRYTAIKNILEDECLSSEKRMFAIQKLQELQADHLRKTH